MDLSDDRQSIYAFRGANVENILRFTEYFPDAQTYNLERNYRSQSVIVDAAEALIKQNERQLPKVCHAVRPGTEKIHLFGAVDDEEEADFIADQIEALADRGYAYEDIAVLYRMNFLSRVIETSLMSHRIPYTVVGSLYFYGRKEIRDVLAMLRAAVNPADNAAVMRLVGLMPGVGEASVNAWLAYATEHQIPVAEAIRELKVRSTKARAGAEIVLDALEKLQFAVAALPLDQFLEYAQKVLNYENLIARSQDSLEEIENRRQNVAELVRAAAQLQEQEPGMLAAMALLDQAMQADGEQKNTGVRLMSMHASKGLEFPVVFLAGMNEGIIPAHSSNLDEERRLCYVGMTRAKDRLYLTHAQSRFARGGRRESDPSPFLKEIPDQFLLVQY